MAPNDQKKGTRKAGAPAASKTKEKPRSKLESKTPSWPPLKPLVPPEDLSVTTVVPNQIVTISNLLSSKLCKDYVAFLNTLPLTTTPGKPKKGDAVRVNDRFQVDDHLFADTLWNQTALKSLVLGHGEGNSQEPWGGEVVGLNPNIRVYRYTKGQFFDQHYDDANLVTLPRQPPVSARTTWTLLIYLTSPVTGCVGGETVFYPEAEAGSKTKRSRSAAMEPVVVGLEVGMALLHKHGADCMLHEGREVSEGEKWVIRSDLCVQR